MLQNAHGRDIFLYLSASKMVNTNTYGQIQEYVSTVCVLRHPSFSLVFNISIIYI